MDKITEVFVLITRVVAMTFKEDKGYI